MNLLDILLPLYLLISLGYIFKQRGFPDANFWPGVEKLAYFVLFPALIFSNLARAQIESGLIGKIFLLIALPTFIIGASQWLGFLSPRLRRDTFSSMYQGAVRNNTTIGLVIAGLIMPGQGVAVMALIMTIMVIINNITCVLVLSRYGDTGNTASQVSGKSILRTILSNPLIGASIAGLAFNFLSIRLPDSLHEAIYFLGQTGLPLALLAVGAGLKLTSFSGKFLPIGLSSFAKLIATPALCYLLLQFIPTTAENAQMFLLYSALPTAMSSYVLASQMGGDKETMAQIITLQTLATSLTLPIVLSVMVALT